jgi:hypothetical protein
LLLATSGWGRKKRHVPMAAADCIVEAFELFQVPLRRTLVSVS